jgi:hypothetical protein
LRDFRDKSGREENGWIGEKGEDTSGKKRLDFREIREREDRSPCKRRYFLSPIFYIS